MTTDETHEINKLKRSVQATCLMTYSRTVFTHQYTKGFYLNICMAASLHLARLRKECSGARWMILPTYGVIATMTSDHDGEATHEGLGIGRWDADDCRWKTLMPKRAEGEPEILNIPKILGGVVAAKTGTHPEIPAQ